MFDPQGTRVLITGASSGLGAALAIGLAERGARVGMCARRADRLAEVAARVREHSPNSRDWTVDLADIDGIDAFAAQVVDELGGLDALVNNAGMPKRRWAWAHRPDEVTDVLRTNVESPIRLTNALLPAIESAAEERGSGHVVFIGSVAARLAPPNESVYSASKAAITAFAEGLHVDLTIAGSRVGVHLVQPGILRTELFSTTDDDPSIADGDVEALEPDAIVGAVLDALGSGRAETFVPEWFGDVPAVKTADLDGFLAGSAEYAKQRLVSLGRPLPTVPSTTDPPATIPPTAVPNTDAPNTAVPNASEEVAP